MTNDKAKEITNAQAAALKALISKLKVVSTAMDKTSSVFVVVTEQIKKLEHALALSEEIQAKFGIAKEPVTRDDMLMLIDEMNATIKAKMAWSESNANTPANPMFWNKSPMNANIAPVKLMKKALVDYPTLPEGSEPYVPPAVVNAISKNIESKPNAIDQLGGLPPETAPSAMTVAWMEKAEAALKKAAEKKKELLPPHHYNSPCVQVMKPKSKAKNEPDAEANVIRFTMNREDGKS